MSNSNIDELLESIFAYGIDWQEYKDTSENDHDVSTFAGKIKAEYRDNLKQAIQQELLKARIDTLVAVRNIEGGTVDAWASPAYQYILNEIEHLQKELKENNDE